MITVKNAKLAQDIEFTEKVLSLDSICRKNENGNEELISSTRKIDRLFIP